MGSKRAEMGLWHSLVATGCRDPFCGAGCLLCRYPAASLALGRRIPYKKQWGQAGRLPYKNVSSRPVLAKGGQIG
jgi:hypothetical protein